MQSGAHTGTDSSHSRPPGAVFAHYFRYVSRSFSQVLGGIAGSIKLPDQKTAISSSLIFIHPSFQASITARTLARLSSSAQ